MYLTINPNSALDRVLFIEQFVPGSRMIPSKTIESVGGKGFDTAVVLRALGLETLTIGYVAGETGRTLVHLLERYGIRHDLIWVEGETRVALVIAETLHHRHSHIIYGNYTVPPQACDDFFTRFRRHVANAQWVIGAGSLPEGLPKDFYQRVIKIAAEHHVPVLIDCPGEPALQAIPARPMILKMNWQEFERTFQTNAATLEELASQATEVKQTTQIPNLVITCGEHGVLALTAQGTFLALPPRQKAVNAAGAGDAVSAALAWRLSLGDNWTSALKWAAATGAAVVLTEGTADCHREDIDRFYSQTTVQELNIC
jgi:1-phosphofructokinase family hexose kinase